MDDYSECEYISEEKWDSIHDDLLAKGIKNDEARRWMNSKFHIKDFENN